MALAVIEKLQVVSVTSFSTSSPRDPNFYSYPFSPDLASTSIHSRYSLPNLMGVFFDFRSRLPKTIRVIPPG